MFRDLLYFYHINLVDFLSSLDGVDTDEEGQKRSIRPGMTPRLLLSLIERLPEGSEFDAEIQGSRDYRDWTLDRWLLVGAINAINTNSTWTVAAAGGKPPKIPPVEGPNKKTARPLEPVEHKSGEMLKAIRTKFLGMFSGGK